MQRHTHEHRISLITLLCIHSRQTRLQDPHTVNSISDVYLSTVIHMLSLFILEITSQSYFFIQLSKKNVCVISVDPLLTGSSVYLVTQSHTHSCNIKQDHFLYVITLVVKTGCTWIHDHPPSPEILPHFLHSEQTSLFSSGGANILQIKFLFTLIYRTT